MLVLFIYFTPMLLFLALKYNALERGGTFKDLIFKKVCPYCKNCEQDDCSTLDVLILIPIVNWLFLFFVAFYDQFKQLYNFIINYKIK